MTMKPHYKICNECESKVQNDIIDCPNCNHRDFRPSFVEKRIKITKNFSVNVIPHFLNKNQKIINLYKWFYGKTPWKININTQDEWEKISSIVENDLAPIVKWNFKDKLGKALKSASTDLASDENIKSVKSEYPKFVLNVIKSLDFKNIDEKNHKHVIEILTPIGEILAKSDESFLVAFKNIIGKLPKQEKLAIVQLEELLKDWSLKQITSVSQIVKTRINELVSFDLAVAKEETFEIRGENSIHRILERAMWIIDERYWLLHSNETLRTVIGNEIVKEYKKDESKRPDFVCGSVDGKLILVELKRPSHKLVVADLNQLEKYLKIVELHSQEFISFEAFLIGKKIDQDLLRTLKYRKSIFKIRTFADLIDDTKRRYREFLKYQNN